jgi:hypothetical protein
MASLAPDVDLELIRGRAVTQENPGTNELLTSILHVLHKLDSRMDEQSKCIQALSEILSAGSTSSIEPRILSRARKNPRARENKKSFSIKQLDNRSYHLTDQKRMKGFLRKERF